MNRKTIFAIIAIVCGALLLGPMFQQQTRQAGTTTTMVNGKTVTTVVPADDVIGYDTLTNELNNDSKDIKHLTFVKDDNGNVQQVVVLHTDGHKSTVEVPGEAGTSKILEAAAKANVPQDASKTSKGFLDVLLGFLPMILIFGVIWFVMRGVGNAANNQRAQIAKIKDSPKSQQIVTFKDVAGAEEAKNELMQIVSYLRNPGRLKRLGGKAPSGVLLIGDPGNGKTLLAKAVAGEAGAEFHEISGSDFVEMYVGVGAARVRDFFSKGREKRPAVLFIDEIDAVGRQRGTGVGGGNDEREQTLNQILVEMDGFKDNEGLIIMAATNRPDILDPALTRPGRLGLHILVDAPDKHGRIGILQVHARGKKLAPGVDLDVIASNTPGFSGAQLAELMNEGARVADDRIEKQLKELSAKGAGRSELSKVAEEITLEDLDEASDRVQMGPKKEGRAKRMSRLDMLNTAVHELGHAWISQDMFERDMGGDPVTKITIVPRARALGYTMSMPSGDRYGYTDGNMRARIKMAMGGRAAQEVILNTIDTGASNDFKQAWSIAHRMVTEFGMSKLGPISIGEGGGNPFLGKQMASGHQLGPQLANDIDNECKRIVEECLAEVKAMIIRDKDCFSKIVDVLMEKETILGPEFRQLRNESACAVVLPLKLDASTGSAVAASAAPVAPTAPTAPVVTDESVAPVAPVAPDADDSKVSDDK
ncbi:MAG: AAA family ATPase [Cyanobacteria bacterium REEB67]|nr:AAA family ATPase [Cyanobacteria bacterium REEB67]